MDRTRYRRMMSGDFPHEVPMRNYPRSVGKITSGTPRSQRTSLGPVSDLITRRRKSVFGHIARLPEDTPAHQALRCHVDLTLGHLSDQNWKRRPCRPNKRWIDQLRRDNNNTPPADLPVEKIHHTWSFGSDATVLDDYALTTTTMYN